MKLGVVTMVRNEIDILEAFANHIDSLFDFVFVVDHMSLDGSSAFLKEISADHPNWQTYTFTGKTKLHAAISNFLLPIAFQQELDFLFFLDADEFIMTRSRAELEKMLNKWKDPLKVGYLTWKLCIPVRFDKQVFSFQDDVFMQIKPSKFRKVIIPRTLFLHKKNNLKLSTGNHTVFTKEWGDVPGEELGILLHIPIRTQEQAMRKAILTRIALAGIGVHRKGESLQYDWMLAKIAAGEVTDADLRSFTYIMDDPAHAGTPLSEADLVNLGYALTSFEKLGVSKRNRMGAGPILSECNLAHQIAFAMDNLESNLGYDPPLRLDGDVISIDLDRIEIRNREKQDVMFELEKQIAIANKNLQSIQNSVSFKIGRMLTFLPRKIRDLFQ